MSRTVAFIRRCLASGLSIEKVLTAAEIFEEMAGQDAASILEERRAKDRERQARRKSLMPENWDELRLVVFRRDRFICTYCEEKTDEPHCDHMIPLSRGGSNDLCNLTTACRDCNTSNGARTVEEWRAAQ